MACSCNSGGRQDQVACGCVERLKEEIFRSENAIRALKDIRAALPVGYDADPDLRRINKILIKALSDEF
jgi:hypothetical protein